jgi:hypothetical protein
MFHKICFMWVKFSRLAQAFFHVGCQYISRASAVNWQNRHTTDRISNKTSQESMANMADALLFSY